MTIFPNGLKHLLLRYTRVVTNYSDKKGTIIAEEFIDGFFKDSFILMKKISTSMGLSSAKASALNVSINSKKLEDLKGVEYTILEDHMPLYQNTISWLTCRVEDNPIEKGEEYDYVP